MTATAQDSTAHTLSAQTRTADRTSPAATSAAGRPRQHHRTPPPVPLAVANISRARARLLRAEWLIGIAQGALTPLDCLVFATTAQGRPLRRISLFQLITAQPGVGPATAKVVLDQIRALLRCTTQNPTMTVGWLLDNRTSGRRLLAFTTALAGRNLAPWPGWPLIRPPTG